MPFSLDNSTDMEFTVEDEKLFLEEYEKLKQVELSEEAAAIKCLAETNDDYAQFSRCIQSHTRKLDQLINMEIFLDLEFEKCIKSQAANYCLSKIDALAKLIHDQIFKI